MSTSRVLVTGATGFLGRYVVHDLRQHGHEVFATGRNSEILSSLADAEHRFTGDLSALADEAFGVDAVIHCAALSTPWGPWRAFKESNVDGTGHVAEFARRNSVRRIVYVSSPSVYAAARDRVGIREDEVDVSNRLNGYIRSKIVAEQLLRDRWNAGDFEELVMIRPRGLIGRGDSSLIPRLLAAHARTGIPVFDGGKNLIDVTAVENVATALRLALDRGNPECGVYNITNDEPRPFRELLATLLELMGRTPRLRPMSRRLAWAVAAALEGACAAIPGRPEPPFTRYTLSTIAFSQTLNIARAKSELGYVPLVSLDRALAAVADEQNARL